jgi:hypothetical protein
MAQIEIYLLAFILHDGVIQMSLVHGNAKNTVIDVAGAKQCEAKQSVPRKWHGGN